jgi:hypothetical protein
MCSLAKKGAVKKNLKRGRRGSLLIEVETQDTSRGARKTLSWLLFTTFLSLKVQRKELHTLFF